MPKRKPNFLKKIYSLYGSWARKLARGHEYTDALFFRMRAMLILWTSTTIVMWLYVGYCLMAFGPKYPVPWGGLVFTLIHSCVPLIWYYTQSFTISGLVLSLSGLGFQTLFCIYTGGVYSPAAIWLTLHPVILGFFGSTELIVFQVVLNFIIVVSLYFVGNLELLPPSILPPFFRDGMIISCYVGLDILVAVFTVVAIRVNNERNRELSNARELTENLLRILCHDINNPLSIIKVSSAQLHPAELAKNPHHAERIKRACDDIQQLTASVGSWIAYRDGKVKLNPKRIPLNDIQEHLRFAFEDRLSNKDITINFSLPEGAENLAILGDRTAVFYQIYNNIVSNAIKFSFEKSVIDVSFSVDGDNVVTKVRDYGVGIDEKIIDKVFSPYDQTTRKGTQNERGTGFGMPIVATVVERMRGKVSIENMKKYGSEETGTQVIVVLPKA